MAVANDRRTVLGGTLIPHPLLEWVDLEEKQDHKV